MDFNRNYNSWNNSFEQKFNRGLDVPFHQEFKSLDYNRDLRRAKRIKILIMVVSGILCLFLVSGIIYLFVSGGGSEFSEEESKEIQGSPGANVGGGRQEAPRNRAQILKNAVPPGMDVVTSCGNFGCFQDEFLECKEGATYDVTLVNEGVSYFFEVLGLEKGKCMANLRFDEHFDPEYIGKEMICEYDHSLGFRKAFGRGTNCRGSLQDYILLKQEQSVEEFENPSLPDVVDEGV